MRTDSRSDSYKEALALLKSSSRSTIPSLLGHGRDLASPSSTSSSTDARAVAALKIHSLAEKKRRERINAHLATLRRMIPDSNKMDKASLLGQVIEQVRGLNRNAANISKVSSIPSELNQVIVECVNACKAPLPSHADNNVHLKVTLCCDDRPDLLSDLMTAFHILSLTAIRAELTSVGGRSHNVFTLCRKDEDGSMCLSSLLESIRIVLSKVASFEKPPFIGQSGKRQRYLSTNYSNRTDQF